MNILSNFFLKKLLVAFYEAKKVQKSIKNDEDAAITIRIINPNDTVKDCSKRLITVLIGVCSNEGFSLYKKIIIPPVNGITEKLIIPFVESILAEKTTLRVANFMNIEPQNEFHNLFVLPTICANNIIFTLPKNDFSYLPMLKEANKMALSPNNDFINKLEKLQLSQEESNKSQMKKKKK